MNTARIHPRLRAGLVLLFAPLLAHCYAPPPDEQPPAPSTVSIVFNTVMDAQRTPISAKVGEAWDVSVQLLEHRPAQCQEDFSRGYHCEPDTTGPVPFRAIAASCDDNLCDVVSPPVALGVIGSLTIIPRATHAVLRIRLEDGGRQAEGTLAIDSR